MRRDRSFGLVIAMAFMGMPVSAYARQGWAGNEVFEVVDAGQVVGLSEAPAGAAGVGIRIVDATRRTASDTSARSPHIAQI